MNVRGERILIFGDSLSHFGADAAPEIWDVDRGSARAGTPGDLLASMLLEQGAQAVRVNARVGRSAHNFFGRENFQALLASDQAWKPTKVIVILGTNDIGLSMAADAISMQRIRDFYKGLGAEVWAIGPFAYLNDRYTNGAPAVVEMMQGVFKPRYLDPRPITAMVGRSRDGVHFGAEAAHKTALGLQQLVMNASTGRGTLAMIGIGVLAAIGGTMAYSYWKTGKASLLSGGKALGTATTPKDAKRQILELLQTNDDESREVARDLALEHGLVRVGTIAKVIKSPKASFGPQPYIVTLDNGEEFATSDEQFKPSSTSFKPGQPIYYVASKDAWWDGKRHLHPARMFESGHRWPETFTKKFINMWWPADGSDPLKGLKGRSAQLPPGAAFLVEDAARAVTKSKRFGDRKVFVADVHEKLIETNPEIDISLDDFKRELVRMQRDGNVKLARADLVAAMPAKKVAASETNADGATFHFVTLDGLGAKAKTKPKAKNRALGNDANGVMDEETYQRYAELLHDPDPKALDIAEDFVLGEHTRLSTISSTPSDRSRGYFNLAPGWRQLESRWSVDRTAQQPDSGLYDCEISLQQYVDGTRLTWDGEKFRTIASLVKLRDTKGTMTQCQRRAAQEAWAISKEMKRAVAELPPNANERDRREAAMRGVDRAIGRDASKEPAELFGLGERCSVSLSPEAFKRCVARQKRAQLGAPEEDLYRPSSDPLGERMRISREITELIQDPDPAAMDVAADLAMQHGIKLSELTKTGLDDHGAIWLDSPKTKPDVFKRDHVSWRVERHKAPSQDNCEASFDVWVDGERVGGKLKGQNNVRFFENYKGSDAYCRRAATAGAWTIAKELKRLRAQGFEIQTPDIWHALDQAHKEPEELFGLGGEREDRDEHPTETFKQLVRDAQTPEELVAAEDYAMAHGIRVRDINRISTKPIGPADAPATMVTSRIQSDRFDGKIVWNIEHEVLWNGQKIIIEPLFPRQGRRDGLDATAAAERWAIVKALKALPADALPGQVRRAVVNAAQGDEAYDEPRRRPDLYGLGARQPITRGSGPNNPDRMNTGWDYIDGDAEFKTRRSEFRRLTKGDGPEALEVAEDFAEQHEIPISQLTSQQSDHADSGVVTIYPQDGSTNVYTVWWDVHEDLKNPGQWEPELLLAWGRDRDTIGSVPHIRNGEWTTPIIPFGSADTVEEARQLAAMNAWNVSKILRELPPDATIEDAKERLRAFEQSHPQDKRFASAHRTFEKRGLFGQSSALQRGMAGSNDGYRVAYSLVTRRDGKIVTVRKIVEAPRALTLPEAEAWRRKWQRAGNTAWVETMAGQHVPVKGAKRPGGFIDDARPGDVHATLTADYARPR